MRLRFRSVLASGRICKVLLLGVVTVATVIPGGDAAFSQTSPGTVAQAPLFTAIDLHPSGFSSSKALGTSGGQQVGYGVPLVSADRAHHALLWRGSAESVVDLHPSGFVSSEAHGISSGEQVGYGGLGPLEHGGDYDTGPFHALLWHGSAGSVVDLHPRGFTSSQALGTSGDAQVGWGSLGGKDHGWPYHALMWRGSAGSVVDLHPSGYASSSQALGISGDQQVGSGWIAVPGGETHALLWHGSAASMMDIHPSGFAISEAVGISDGQQVGSGRRDADCIGPPPTYALLWRGSAGSAVDLGAVRVAATSGGEQVGDGYDQATGSRHALLWRGSAGVVVDLHAFLPPGFQSSSATGIDADGDIVGYAAYNNSESSHAFVWKRNGKPILPIDRGVTPQDLTAPKPLFISSDSSDNSVAYILTDPQGRRTGYDPVHNMSYHEIPGAVYRIDSCERDQWTVLGTANRMAGRYTLDVFGGGDLRVYVLAWGASGHWLTYAFEGTAPGGSSRFTFPGEVITFAAFKATLKIDPASGAFEVNGTYTMGPGGTVSPATQDVTIAVAGYFTATIPAGSFRQSGHGAFVFKGVINGVTFEATLTPTGVNSGAFKIEGANAARIEGTKDEFWIGRAEATKPDYPINVELAIGNNGGNVSVHAELAH